MRSELIAAAVASMLIASACGNSPGDGPANLVTARVDAVFAGPAIDDRNGDLVIRIDEVLYDRGPYRDEEGALVIPDAVLAGAGARVGSPVHLVEGDDYLVVAQREDAYSSRWTALGVLVPGTYEPLLEFVPLPRDLVLPGEVGAEAEIVALVEFLRDKTRRERARGDVPISRRFARAIQVSAVNGGAPATIGDGEVAIEDYLLLRPSRRSLPTGSGLPEIVAEMMGLVPMTAAIVVPNDLAVTHEAVGVMTSAGVLGPVQLSPGVRVVEIDGWRPVEGSLDVIVWQETPDPRLPAEGAAPLGAGALSEALSEVGALHVAGETVVIDIARGEVRSVEAGELEQLARGSGSGQSDASE